MIITVCSADGGANIPSYGNFTSPIFVLRSRLFFTPPPPTPGCFLFYFPFPALVLFSTLKFPFRAGCVLLLLLEKLYYTAEEAGNAGEGNAGELI